MQHEGPPHWQTSLFATSPDNEQWQSRRAKDACVLPVSAEDQHTQTSAGLRESRPPMTVKLTLLLLLTSSAAALASAQFVHLFVSSMIGRVEVDALLRESFDISEFSSKHVDIVCKRRCLFSSVVYIVAYWLHLRS